MITDLIAARRSARAYAKYALRKTVFTDRLFDEYGLPVSARTQFVYNVQTDVCNPSCALYAGGEMFYPTKQLLRDALPTTMGAIRHTQCRRRVWRRASLPKKSSALFPIGADVIVSLCSDTSTNVVSSVHKMGKIKYIPIHHNVSPAFVYDADVTVTRAQHDANTQTIKFKGRYIDGTASEISLQYAKIFDENGVWIGTISAQAETSLASWDNVWTGSIEVCFQPTNSTELVLLGTVASNISPSDMRRNVWKAKACIQQCYVAAKEYNNNIKRR